MFFIVSKILDFLMQPISWILILLIWMFISKNKKIKKRLLIISILTAVVFSNHFIYQKIVMAWQSKPLTIAKGNKEADFIKNELITSGVAEKDILIENKSRNTYENAIFSKRILDSLQLKGPYVLITSATHMPRSINIFKKAEISIIPFPSDYRVIDSRISWQDIVIPDMKLLNEWSIILHEIIGLKIYQLTGKA